MAEEMSKEGKKIRFGFWAVFAGIMALVLFSTYTNMSDYKRMEKLNTKGIRVYGVVNKAKEKRNKTTIEVVVNIKGKEYIMSKDVKAAILIGDSVPVYYLDEDPEVREIAFQ
jgi:hypothetical protein